MRSFRTPLLLSAVAILTVALSGCMGTDKIATHDIDAVKTEAAKAQDSRRSVEGHRGPANVRYRNTVWLGDVGVKSTSGRPLPEVVEGPESITIASTAPMSLVELARRITLITGIEVTGVNQLGINRPGGPELTDPNEDPRHIQAIIDYTGPLSGLLDLVSSKFGVSWEYRQNRIRIFDFETRTFTLIVPPMAAEVSTEMESTLNATGSGSTGTDSEQTSENGVSFEAELDYWSRIGEDLDALVPEGTRYSISPEAGSIVVTARPAVLERIEAYVKDQNARMSRQVAFSIKVLSIETNENEGVSGDLGFILDDISGDLNVGVVSLAPGVATASTSLLSTPFNNGRLTPDFQGAEGVLGRVGDGDDGALALIKAISAHNRTSLVTSAAVTTMNGMPAPVQVSQDISYISGYEQSNVNEGTIVTPESDTVKIGFSMNVLPRILPNNRLALNYIIGISELDRLRVLGTGDFQIEAPEVSSRGFQQSVVLNSGDTLILAGFERVGSATQDEGRLFGFGTSATKSHELIVLLLTPVVIENPADLAAMR